MFSSHESLLFGPDELGGGGSAAPASAAAPSPSPAPSPAPSATPAMPGTGDAGVSAGAGGAGQATGAAAGPTGQANDFMGVREALAAYGIDLRGQFQDDHAALQHIALAYQQSRQANELAQYGRQYLQHAGEFQSYLQQRQAQQRQAQQQGQQWFKAPEYDPRWQNQITRDQTTGEMRPAPGAPPDVVQKYVAWATHQSDFQQKMAQDPIGTLKPGLEQVIRETAQQLIQEQLGGYQERTAAQGFVEQHSGWIHARDGQGNVLRDPQTGRPALSELGQRFAGYVHQAEQMGARTVADQQRYAMALVQRDYALAQLSQAQQAQPGAPGAGAGAAQPANPNQAARDAFLAGAAAHRPNAGGSVTPPAASGQPPSQNPSLGLRERLNRDFQANGYNLSSSIMPG